MEEALNWEILAVVILVAMAMVNLARPLRSMRRSPDPEVEKAPEEGPPEPERFDLERENALLRDQVDMLRLEVEHLREALGSAATRSGPDDESSFDPGKHGVALMILGLDPDQPVDRMTLRRAYARSVRRNHPDHGGSDHALILVLRAYDYLKEINEREVA